MLQAMRLWACFAVGGLLTGPVVSCNRTEPTPAEKAPKANEQRNAAPAATAGLASQPAPSPAKPAAILPDTLRGVREFNGFYAVDPADLPARFAGKLLYESQEAKDFATAELAAHPETGVREIVRVLESALERGGNTGGIINCCQALAAAKTRDTKALELLKRVLRGDVISARSDAARALGFSGDPNVLPALKSAFNLPSPESRKAILLAIGDLKTAAAAEYLGELALSDHVAIGFRQEALGILGKMPVELSAPVLRKCTLLAAPMGEASKVALSITKEPQFVAFARSVATDPTNLMCGFAASILARSGEFDASIQALRSSDASVRALVGLRSIREAVEAFQNSGNTVPQPVIEALLTRLEDTDPTVRVESARILVLLKITPPLEREIEYLRSGDPHLATAALDILTDGMVADWRATAPILELLEKAPFARKRGYAQALGRLKDPAAVPTLERYVTGPSVQIDSFNYNDYFAIQLSNLGAPGFEALLRCLASSEDPARRLAIVTAITHCTTPKDKIYAALRAIGEDQKEHPEIRAVVLRFLPKYVRTECLGYLRRLLEREENSSVRNLINTLLHTYF